MVMEAKKSDSICKNLGYGIVKFIGRVGLSQTDLAKKLGINPQNISKWKSGKGSLPSLRVVKKLFEAGITVKELLDVDYNKIHKLVSEELLQQAFVSREEFENLKVELGIKKAAGVG
jgi:transcriptional regulator with XRE-family HTH domain